MQDTVFLRNLHIFLNVALTYFYFSFKHSCHLRHHRRHHFAGDTPVGIKIHQHRQIGFQNLTVEILRCKLIFHDISLSFLFFFLFLGSLFPVYVPFSLLNTPLYIFFPMIHLYFSFPALILVIYLSRSITYLKIGFPLEENLSSYSVMTLPSIISASLCKS